MKKLSLLVLPIAAMFSLLAAPVIATAQSKTAAQIACESAGGSWSGSGCVKSNPAEKGVDDTVRAAVSILSYIAGVASIVMVIVGGIKYVVSSGDSNAVGSAKNTITYALVGLVIAIMAQAMVRFVFTKSTS